MFYTCLNNHLVFRYHKGLFSVEKQIIIMITDKLYFYK